MEIILAPVSTRYGINIPLPVPISNTKLFFEIFALSTMNFAISSDLRKFCPSFFCLFIILQINEIVFAQ